MVDLYEYLYSDKYMYISMLVESRRSSPLNVLMVSPEYPPMPGGVGRYTSNLTRGLLGMGLEVQVACDKVADGEFPLLSQSNKDNSKVLLDLVNKTEPDIVHIQYEPGLYGLKLDTLNPRRTSTNIDEFYTNCNKPIVTTFHSAYTFRQWLDLVVPVNGSASRSRFIKGPEYVLGYWKRLVNYYSFHRLNKQKLARSRAGVAFSRYMSEMVGGCDIIFHGAERNKFPGVSAKKEVRKLLSLPQEGRIALVLGYATATKGWDIIEKMRIPDGWTIVINASTNHYSKEKYQMNLTKTGRNLIDLRKDFLTEEDLFLLFSAADAVILPYKVSSGSGVMFDALAHGLPFVATNLEFFNEFSAYGLGITVDRKPQAFSDALVSLDGEYKKYADSADRFGKEISWKEIARRHVILYDKIATERKPRILS